ncbi:hypothetical protein BRE01_19110 [Brevibacillus reuszeri]|uniref:Cell division protein FtsK n=1 Tax=Brevibacillus reuszeri TaxID=54915 RepID=A0A0K9YXJ2_9BACL|nr:penicillin-binding transpeptidase domain-containing protein [Brevibacillus reuszeri]KNB73408.1 cell division protein FtsK [Brevibacillus reuszeri]MED1857036.1 penicillin-binding transpeptidase domain-containing protein [Brevibacillus reuszeri]GED68209.1 hypothetical protein BRE01_19110 [Brevibacillus reuszeri]
MTPSSEEKEIRALFHSFPLLRIEEDKQQMIAGHIREEKELLMRMKRRKTVSKVIGAIAASFALFLIAYQVVISMESPSVQSAQIKNEPVSPGTTAAGTAEQKAKVTTINPQIQAYVEEALNKTNQVYSPESMTVIVTDPHTGEILAMANRMPNKMAKEQEYAGRAVPDPVPAYPIVTLAAAIQEGKFDPNEIYDSGTYEVAPGKLIKDPNNGIGWGEITYLEGVLSSSNVAFAKLGNERLQKGVLEEYLKRFGFGNQTGIELEGEEAGSLPTMEKPYEVANAAMGKGATATALQQVAALGVIANGGELMRPHLYKNADTDTRSQYMVRQVISEEAAKQVREILESAVSSKFASLRVLFKLDEYSVAGNSGVAPKYDAQGNVIDGKNIATFIGYAPSDDPKLLIYVSVDEPKTDPMVALWWGPIISPIFKEVMANSLQHLQKE